MVMPARSRLEVPACEMDEQSWAPFGWLPVRDTDPGDGSHRLRFDWSDAHANIICHRSDEVPSSPRGLVCRMLYRHLTHTQVLLVLNCEAVLAVAPASCQFAQPSDFGLVKAFVVRPHDALVLHPGTWHWGPFPIAAPQVDMFNVQGLRYAEDNDCIDLAPLGVDIDVVVPAKTLVEGSGR